MKLIFLIGVLISFLFFFFMNFEKGKEENHISNDEFEKKTSKELCILGNKLADEEKFESALEYLKMVIQIKKGSF